MDRRKFFSVTGAGAAAVATGGIPAAEAAPKKAASGACASASLQPLKARLGHQMNGKLNDSNCSWAARYGLDAICASPDVKDPSRLYPTAEELNQMLDIASKHKLKVEVIDSILLTSSNVDREKHPAIVLGQSPERDRDIEAFQTNIRNCAATGIRTLKYNMSILGVVRSSKVPGRGDTVYNKWNYKEALAQNKPQTRAGNVSENEFWDRIEYFLSKVVPVANENKVRIACHPQDPGMPPEGYLGIHNVLGTIDGLKKFVGLHESAYHGLNFCQGTVSEDLQDPNAEIGDVIRWFGSRKKIFNVHFRNIRGHRDDFVAEMFPDEGDVDFVKALKAYREVGYEDLLMPDHAPEVVGDAAQWGGRENFAFEFGYIRGLIQAEKHLV
ncbi:MAG TPA: mannonate dehydratase [Rhizomicrobium sp.]|nr:mannonate dehydratase [Rhizomicrobium sp.]